MLITGASGHALEILDIILHQVTEEEIFFFDNISPEITIPAINKYRVLRSADELPGLFSHDNRFVLGTGSPAARKLLMRICLEAGGRPGSVISPHAIVSNIGIILGEGLNIMHGAILHPHVTVGKGTLINCRAIIHHECVIGEFCEISPGAIITGNVTVGHNTSIGTGAVVLPKLSIGNNVCIAAGAVVTQHVPDNVMVAGVPAAIKKTISPKKPPQA